MYVTSLPFIISFIIKLIQLNSVAFEYEVVVFSQNENTFYGLINIINKNNISIKIIYKLDSAVFPSYLKITILDFPVNIGASGEIEQFLFLVYNVSE